MKLLTFMCPLADDSRTDDARLCHFPERPESRESLKIVVLLIAACLLADQSQAFDLYGLKRSERMKVEAPNFILDSLHLQTFLHYYIFGSGTIFQK